MPIYAVTIAYRDRELRDQVRPAHRAYLQARLDDGTLVESGPFMDDSGALLVYEVETEARLYEILAEDPFWQNQGVIGDETVKEWNRIFLRD
jgi:uncharacterized protein YciI